MPAAGLPNQGLIKMKQFNAFPFYKEQLQPFSQHARNQQVSAYNHSFVSIIQRFYCKQVPFGLLYAVKMAEVVLLKVFRIGFPASLLLFIYSRHLESSFNVVFQFIIISPLQLKTMPLWIFWTW